MMAKATSKSQNKMKKVARDGSGPGTAPGRPGVLPVARSAKTGAKPDRVPPPLWSNFGKILEPLPEIAAEVLELNRQKKELDEQIKIRVMAIKGLMEEVDDSKSWSCRDIDADWVAIYVKPNPSNKIVPELLIQQGVTMKQIIKATKLTPKNGYVQVRARNEAFETSNGGDDE